MEFTLPFGPPQPSLEERREHQSRVFDGDIKETIDDLEVLFNAYLHEGTPLEAGDFVRWKPGLKNRNVPYGQPMVIMETGFAMVETENDINSASPYFREPLDVRVGLLMPDGEFSIFYMDSKRLEIHDGELTEEERDRLDRQKAKDGEEEVKEVEESTEELPISRWGTSRRTRKVN